MPLTPTPKSLIAFQPKLKRNRHHCHAGYNDGCNSWRCRRQSSSTTADDNRIHDIGVDRAVMHHGDALYAVRVRGLGTPHPQRSHSYASSYVPRRKQLCHPCRGRFRAAGVGAIYEHHEAIVTIPYPSTAPSTVQSCIVTG